MKYRFLALIMVFLLGCAAEPVAAAPVKVLFVGGDWKSQLTRFQGKTPMRGHWVEAIVNETAPGQFQFTHWTSYEFLQYADVPTLEQYDVIVCGDVMAESILPRTVAAVRRFVQDGGGFWYCDNHKAFGNVSRELSFDAVLPVDVPPAERFTQDYRAPFIQATTTRPVTLHNTQVSHPITAGLDSSTAPPLGGAHYGKPKPGAVVLAEGPEKEPLWVAGEVGKGHSFWSGGVFANDELSQGFSQWRDVGHFYVHALAWLARQPRHASPNLVSTAAPGTLTVDSALRGPEVTARHFGIHGQEFEPNGGSAAMEGADLALYRTLHLDGGLARTSAFQGIKTKPQGKPYEFLDDGTDLHHFDWSLYDFARAGQVVDDLQRYKAEPIFLYWAPWHLVPTLDPGQWAKHFAASAQYATTHYPGVLHYYELLNEPDLTPLETELPLFAQFFNTVVGKLQPLYPTLSFGCGGMAEGPVLEQLIEAVAGQAGWISRHAYGLTGEAVFYWHDRYRQAARSSGHPDLKFIITEWDFWLYGAPAFDYLMMRWKPLLDRADSCIGTLQYRWREYAEGGYVFGLHGEFDKPYGELPTEWPNPGRDKPITYRYNAFWIMRNLRGGQHAVHLDVPLLAGRVADDAVAYQQRLSNPQALSTHAYALATSDGHRYTIVVYYGEPVETDGQRITSLHLHLHAGLPPGLHPQHGSLSTANDRTIQEVPMAVRDGAIDTDVDVPAESGIAISVW